MDTSQLERPTPNTVPAPHPLLLVDPRPASTPTPDVEIVVPVYDEAAGLGASIRRLHAYLTDRFPLSWVVTIADNASTDGTWPLACGLARELDGVRAAHLDRKGRGRALRATWSASRSPVVAYMDVDLSTDLDALLPLVAPLVSGHSDVAIGTRLSPAARVRRGPRREVISRSYNLILKATLHNGFSDAQCGFKAIRRDAAARLLPLVEDEAWFFDTELLVLAEHNGYRIHEVPVDWVDDPDSRVDVVQTATEDLKGVWRMARRLARGRATDVDDGERAEPDAEDRTGWRGTEQVGGGLAEQLVRFASVGAVSTVLFALLFATLVGPLGPVGADVVALAICSLANVAANRRLTFALQGRSGRRRHYTAGLLVALLPLALNLAALAAMAAAGATTLAALLLGLTVANGVATMARFLLMRNWVFRPAAPAVTSSSPVR